MFSERLGMENLCCTEEDLIHKDLLVWVCIALSSAYYGVTLLPTIIDVYLLRRVVKLISWLGFTLLQPSIDL